MTLADIALTVLLSLAVLVVVATVPVMFFAIDWMCWRAYGDGEGWYAPDQGATEQLPVLSGGGDGQPTEGGFDFESVFGFLAIGLLDFFGDGG